MVFTNICKRKSCFHPCLELCIRSWDKPYIVTYSDDGRQHLSSSFTDCFLSHEVGQAQRSTQHEGDSGPLALEHRLEEDFPW